MMTEKQKSKVTRLKDAIAATAPTRQGAPLDVRSEVIELKQELQREGTTARVLAAALGVHESTLCRWERDRSEAQKPTASRTKRRSGSPSRFRMVEVTPPTTLATSTLTSTSTSASAALLRGLRVAHAPSGLVIDGLDVETLAALLRRMS